MTVHGSIFKRNERTANIQKYFTWESQCLPGLVNEMSTDLNWMLPLQNDLNVFTCSRYPEVLDYSIERFSPGTAKINIDSRKHGLRLGLFPLLHNDAVDLEYPVETLKNKSLWGGRHVEITRVTIMLGLLLPLPSTSFPLASVVGDLDISIVYQVLAFTSW